VGEQFLSGKTLRRCLYSVGWFQRISNSRWIKFQNWSQFWEDKDSRWEAGIWFQCVFGFCLRAVSFICWAWWEREGCRADTSSLGIAVLVGQIPWLYNDSCWQTVPHLLIRGVTNREKSGCLLSRGQYRCFGLCKPPRFASDLRGRGGGRGACHACAEASGSEAAQLPHSVAGGGLWLLRQPVQQCRCPASSSACLSLWLQKDQEQKVWYGTMLARHPLPTLPMEQLWLLCLEISPQRWFKTVPKLALCGKWCACIFYGYLNML